MKRGMGIVFAVGILIIGHIVYADNPLIKDIGMSDPHVRIFNDTVYLYTGHDDDPNDPLWVMKEWRVFRSNDLVDWEQVATISPKDNYMDDNSISCWAGDAAERNGKYYFYFSDHKNGVGVMKADRPEGPFVDALGKPLVSPMHDPTILIDDDEDETPYIIYGDKEGGGFHIARLNDDMISVAETSRPITINGKEWANAPKWMDKNYIFKYNGTYYLSWGRDYAISDNIYGPYECVGAVGRGHNLDQFAHGSFFWWKGQFYHIWCYYLRNGFKYRESIITYCHFDDNGNIVTDTDFLDKHFATGVGLYDASWDKIEAEWYYEIPEGPFKQNNKDGGFELAGLENGSWIRYANMDFGSGYNSFTINLTRLYGEGSLEIRTGSADGPLVGTINVDKNMISQEQTSLSVQIEKVTGKKDLFIKVFGDESFEMSIDWFNSSNSDIPSTSSSMPSDSEDAYSAFVQQKVTTIDAPGSAEYQSMTFNGAWTWFSDPRAVYFEGQHKRTYSGWVDNYGNIHVAYYDHDTRKIQSKIVCENLEINDHNNPSILFDEEGRLLVFFTTHILGTKPIYLVKSSMPENIDSWEETKELFLNDPALRSMGGMNHTYSHPVKLSAEKGRIYLFWRGVDGNPSFSHSDDNGENWTKGKIFFMPEKTYSFRRPYTKVYSDGIDKIHITVTDGHPRNEADNNIYYMYLQGGVFYRADGTKIKDIDNLPVLPEEADLVYDAKTGRAKAWNWDIAQDKKGNPVIAYAKFPNDTTHIYCYAKWDKKGWQNFDLINSGKWFPETLEGIEEPEPNYSGGMSIDKESPNTLYLSVNRGAYFEIEKWEADKKFKKWKITPITSGSTKDNVRPFAVRGAEPGNPVQVLWMQNTKYIHFAFAERFKNMGGTFETRFHSSIKMDVISPKATDFLKKDDILIIMHQTADWQMANPFYRADKFQWHYEPLFKGFSALYDLTGQNRYKDELYHLGKARDWAPMPDIFNADRMAIVDTWSWLYQLEKEPEIIEKGREALDRHLAKNYEEETDVRFKDNPRFALWWSWCDALFMAPPALAHMAKITGEEKYLDYMNTQWWKTSDYLYSVDDSLYYRDDRYFDRLTNNGKKIFWSRGNGWVLAGLARVLLLMPENYEHRSRYEQQYREMAHKILSIQGEDGLWRVSLADPEFLDIGESSGSALFTYALAWGINNGLLNADFRPQVEKAWLALCNNVNQEGMLGYVQHVAADPYPFKKEQWHVYATGAFLMAGEQIYQLVGK